MYKLHKFEDSIILGGTKALILPHCPSKITLEQISNKIHQHPQEVLKLGLFDLASPNYSTYYPDSKPEDFVPNKEDIVKPVVRALSEVVVHKNVNPVDFSEGNVIKDSTSLLYGQSVMVDHEDAIGNILGSVSDTFYEKGYKSKEGIPVPSGINALLSIDGKSHTNIVRKMNMDPPAIHSVSVTVMFGWKPSHEQVGLEDFMRKIGTYDEKGNQYRRIATGVRAYKEISLVSHGADPYAQIIKSGQINNPKYADLIYNNAEGKPAGIKYYFMDFKDILSNSEGTIPEETNLTEDQTQNIQMKEILLLLAASLKVDAGTKDEATLAAELQPKLSAFLLSATDNETALATAKTDLTTAQTALTEAQGKATTLEAQLKDLPAIQQFGEEAKTALKAETLRVATLANGGKLDPAIATLIEKGDFATLKVLKGQYELQADEKYPTTCKKCGSKEVSRASAAAPDPKDEGNKKVESFRDKTRNKQMEQAAAMHGESKAEEKK